MKDFALVLLDWDQRRSFQSALWKSSGSTYRRKVGNVKHCTTHLATTQIN